MDIQDHAFPNAVTEYQALTSAWFAQLRDQICASYEALEDEGNPDFAKAGRFTATPWQRPGGGGGVMAVMKGGRVFEKVGVNMSTVHGTFSPEFRASIPGAQDTGAFWASGISIVAHPRSPHVPAAHFNTRFLVTSRTWFGGGGDMTPVFPKETETQTFHRALQAACDRHDATYYPTFKAWCDRYFYLPHRGEARGVGGIFYDELNTGNFHADFAFAQDVGRAFASVYPSIVRDAMPLPWTDRERQAQLIKRGRYVEFNLLYDRGTLFGLKTDGNVEAILMSLPPLVAWG